MSLLNVFSASIGDRSFIYAVTEDGRVYKADIDGRGKITQWVETKSVPGTAATSGGSD